MGFDSSSDNPISLRLFENAHPTIFGGTKSLDLLNRLRRLALREFNRARNGAYAKGLRHKAQGSGEEMIF